MSESQKNLMKPPRSPPMDIPRRRERTVYNTFFPEPSKKNIITRFDIMRNNTIQFKSLKKELIYFKENLYIFTELQKGEKLGKQEIPQNKKINNDDDAIEEKDKKATQEKDEEITQEKDEEITQEKDEETKIKKYYKQTPYMGMWIARWWYSESREKTIDYLDEDFTKFMNYLDRILNNLKCDPTGIYVNLVNEIREFIDQMIPGLYNLKQTYPSVVKVVAKVDSIILTLLDFKEKTDDYLARKQQNVRLTIKSKKIPIFVDTTQYDEMPPNSI